MQKHIEKKFIDAFPQLFVDMYGDSKVTCMAFGCDHGEGWEGLLWKLCEDIQKQLDKYPEPNFKFTQVKQKLGCLIVYHVNSENDVIHQLIDNAAEESTTICEQCGSVDMVVTVEAAYITPLCKHCRAL
jgi:hypothetical protein